MREETIKIVVKLFAKELKKIYGSSLHDVILYGSCARGDFMPDSDIDLMILLDIPKGELGTAREKISDISDQCDLNYDVVLSPVVQNYRLYQKYMSASVFYQNVQKEGIRIA